MFDPKPTDRRPILHRGMAWDTKIAIGLFVLCLIGPAVMSHPTFWTWVVTGLHLALMILFYYVVKHIGHREEREAREAAFAMNAPLPDPEAERAALIKKASQIRT